MGRHFGFNGGKHSKKVVTRSTAWPVSSARSASVQVRSQSDRLSDSVVRLARVSATSSAGTGSPFHQTPISMAWWAIEPRAFGTVHSNLSSCSAR